MRRVVGIVLRVGLGVVFAYAALSKLPDLRTFAEEIANYQLLPAKVVPAFAVVLPGIELVCGLALVFGVYARAAALVSSTMLVVFVAGLSQALWRGIDLRCGCFGGAELATWGTVLRDVVLLAVAMTIVWLESRTAVEHRATA